MSSDNTADVARHFAGAFERYVSHLECEIFWGTNSAEPPLTKFAATGLHAARGGWKQEVLAQLRQIREKRPSISHVIVFLDDFILRKPVDFRAFSPMFTDAVEVGWKYLRLAPIEEAFFSRWISANEAQAEIGGRRCVAIRRSHPYYASLQVAMWEVDYLIDCVSRAKDIWSFETQASEVQHYSVLSPVVVYRHAVEKGEWDHGARRLCLKHAGFFKPGSRTQRSGIVGEIRRHFVRARFAVAGYAPSRLKRVILGQQPFR